MGSITIGSIRSFLYAIRLLYLDVVDCAVLLRGTITRKPKAEETVHTRMPDYERDLYYACRHIHIYI